MDEQRPARHPANPTGEADDDRLINDRRFNDQLEKIFALKSFLVQEEVVLTAEQLAGVDLGPLNNFEFGAAGRKPTQDEWKLLDEKFSSVCSCLDDELRQTFKISQLRVLWILPFKFLPFVFLFFTVIAVIAYAMNYHPFPEPCDLCGPPGWGHDLSYLGITVVWAIAQGGLGACAYLAVQASAKKNGRERGLSNLFKESLALTDFNVKIRIILGSLFGFVLGIAIAEPGLEAVSKGLRENIDAANYALIVAPFLLGFSTSLVLAILDRLVVSVRIFLGIGSPAESPRTSAPQDGG